VVLGTKKLISRLLKGGTGTGAVAAVLLFLLVAALGYWIAKGIMATHAEGTERVRARIEAEAKTRGERWSRIREFTYEGHQYIHFYRHRNSGVVHNPECECGR